MTRRLSLPALLALSGAVIALTGVYTGTTDQLLVGALLAVVGIAGWTVP